MPKCIRVLKVVIQLAESVYILTLQLKGETSNAVSMPIVSHLEEDGKKTVDPLKLTFGVKGCV